MRIISGKYRGRKLKWVKNDSVRPTQDRVREALFNIIKAKIKAVSVLDLYAGSGSFGLEAISQGADKAVFVEKDPKSCKIIRDNIETLCVGANTRVLMQDSVESIGFLAKTGYKFDIVFMDPPYYNDLIKNTLLAINKYDILTPYSIIVAEHHQKDFVPESFGKFALCKSKQYGDTFLSFYTIKGTADV